MRCRCEPKSESGTEIIAKNGSYEVKNTDLTKGRNHCNIQIQRCYRKADGPAFVFNSYLRKQPTTFARSGGCFLVFSLSKCHIPVVQVQ